MKKENKNIFDIIQYLISIAISILFIIGLISTKFQEYFQITIGLIILQILLSSLRIRLINIIIELSILIFALIGYIPYLGYFFRFLGFLVSLLDISIFKSQTIDNKIKIIYRNIKSKNYKENKNLKQKFYSKKFENNIKDAQFKEK